MMRNNVVGFTVAWGSDRNLQAAERVLALWSYHHGRARTVLIDPSGYMLDEREHIRTRVLDHVDDGDIAVYMDTDTVCLHNTLPDLGDAVLGMAADGDMQSVMRTEPRLLWYNRTYYNTGYFMVRKTPETVAMFNDWWGLRRACCGRYKDQSTFNQLTKTSSVPIQLLPSSCNYFMRWKVEEPPGGTCILHWAGVSDFLDEQDAWLTREERSAGIQPR